MVEDRYVARTWDQFEYEDEDEDKPIHCGTLLLGMMLTVMWGIVMLGTVGLPLAVLVWWVHLLIHYITQ